jgi:PAS domain S-box-containing protein
MRQPSLRTLIVALIVVLILPFIGAALFVMIRLSDAEHQTREAQSLGIARAFSSEVDRQLLNAEAALNALATSPELRGGDFATFYRQCAAVAEQHGARVVLADAAAGRQIFNTALPFSTPMAQLKQTPLARRAVAAQKTQISDLFRGTTTEDYLVGVFVPVSPDASRQQVLIMAFRPERLSSFFAEQHVPDEWTVAIVDRSGTVIGRSHALEWFFGKPVTDDLKSAIDGAGEGFANLHTQDGIEIYTAFTRSNLSGWTVAFGVPRSVVEAPLRRSLVEIGIAGGVVIILCGFAALYAARRISRSMTHLSAAALALGNGQQLPRLTPRIKEMDEITRSLRTAADTLARRSEERDRAETALRESEQRFRDIAELGGDRIWELDAEHRFTLVTGAHIEGLVPLRLTPADALGRTPWQVVGVDPETDPLWRQHKADLDAHRPFRNFQYSANAPSGAPLHLAVSGNPVFDRYGLFRGYRGTTTNVTDTVNALQRAESAEALLRDAVNSMSEGFVIYDREDRLVMYNETYRRLFLQSIEGIPAGTTYEEVLRANVRSGQHALPPEEAAGWIAQKLKEHHDAEGGVEHQLSDGRWVLITDRRMRNGGIAGLRVDISTLKAVQAELRDSREHLARAQRVAATGSFELDLRTRGIEWSDETYRIFGVTPDVGPLDQDKLEGMVIPEDRERLRDQIAACVDGQQQTIMEYRIRRPDGGIRVLYRDVEVMRDVAGQPCKLIGVVRDVTELREAERRRDELERELMHSQKLEALGTLAGGVAHDLNNTLVPILALSKLALEEIPQDSVVRGDIEAIISASRRARDLVKQILVFSRKQTPAKREVDLVAVISEALGMLRASLPATIEIIEQVTQVPPLFGDPTQLHQVVVNLVTNAAQAIGDKVGQIRISVRSPIEQTASPQTSGGEPLIYMSIADTGCGMDAATIDRIFEPFFTTREVGEGTGLGLSVVHGIVAGHGGTINVHSQPGEGTEITLSLPALHQATLTAPLHVAAA